ncbi:hypothetical protein [Filimonas lacunae]|uniref:hypothetical protein n=1 Tax=Filimonas lacunae TaxID=477680 RepID=UPI0007D73692|nr:hypothetical protein [Filimonas lacunae]BAV04338.1 hypothetical protein FLA_0326 [Filimonas lacunae]
MSNKDREYNPDTDGDHEGMDLTFRRIMQDIDTHPRTKFMPHITAGFRIGFIL